MYEEILKITIRNNAAAKCDEYHIDFDIEAVEIMALDVYRIKKDEQYPNGFSHRADSFELIRQSIEIAFYAQAMWVGQQRRIFMFDITGYQPRNE